MNEVHCCSAMAVLLVSASMLMLLRSSCYASLYMEASNARLISLDRAIVFFALSIASEVDDLFVVARALLH